jgi:Protein of unknown function (DUF664)
MSANELQRRLSDSIEYIRRQLETLTLQELSEMRTSPRDEEEFTVAWAFLHALEHTALHVGQIQITRQLWHQRQIA